MEVEIIKIILKVCDIKEESYVMGREAGKQSHCKQDRISHHQAIEEAEMSQCSQMSKSWIGN